MAQKEKITYTVYKHTSPDGKIYIGITSIKPQIRWSSGYGYKTNSYFTRAIKKYGWQAFKHEILLEGLSEEEAKAKEIELIAYYESNQRKYGYNISSGGESRKGTTISKWHKEQISKASKGRIVTKETRQKLSIASKKSWKNPEYAKKMPLFQAGEDNPRFGKQWSIEEKKQRGAKAVQQLSMDGKLINEYISLHEAYEKTGIDRDGIRKCCKGIFKQYHGFLWKYAND